jgi:hypothetical protein
MGRGGALVLLIAASISACSLFHKESPQQKLFDALNRGNGPMASQIWLSMSPEDRLKFNRGEGITPAIPPQEVVKTLTRMAPDQMQGEITIKPANAGSTLLDLPALLAPQSVTPPSSGPSSNPEAVSHQD